VAEHYLPDPALGSFLVFTGFFFLTVWLKAAMNRFHSSLRAQGRTRSEFLGHLEIIESSKVLYVNTIQQKKEIVTIFIIFAEQIFQALKKTRNN